MQFSIYLVVTELSVKKLPKELNPTKILHKYMDDYYTDKTKEEPPEHRDIRLLDIR